MENKLRKWLTDAIGVDRYNRGYSETVFQSILRYIKINKLEDIPIEDILVLYFEWINFNEPDIQEMVKSFRFLKCSEETTEEIINTFKVIKGKVD